MINGEEVIDASLDGYIYDIKLLASQLRDVKFLFITGVIIWLLTRLLHMPFFSIALSRGMMLVGVFL